MKNVAKLFLITTILLGNSLSAMERGYFSDSEGTTKKSQRHLYIPASNPSITSHHLTTERIRSVVDSVKTARPLDPSLSNFLIETSPQKLKTILEELALPCTSTVLLPKTITLLGKTGMGKTDLCTAIAQHLKRKPYVIAIPFIIDRFQHDEAKNIHRALAPILATQEPAVVIIDEMDVIIDAYKIRPYGQAIIDNFCAALDECHKNPNIIVACTSRDITEYPQELKQKLIYGLVEIGPSNVKQRKDILNYYLLQLSKSRKQTEQGILDPSITDDYLEELAKNTHGFSNRGLNDIVYLAFCNAEYRTNQHDTLPSKEDLEDGLAQMKYNLALFRRSSKQTQESIAKHSSHSLITPKHICASIAACAAAYGLFKLYRWLRR